MRRTQPITIGQSSSTTHVQLLQRLHDKRQQQVQALSYMRTHTYALHVKEVLTHFTMRNESRLLGLYRTTDLN